MELQWALILFTTLLSASAGLFAVQGGMAILGKGTKAQLPALITSAVLLVVGGIAVFFHLQHWERIFNGFGHLTSGITQELIVIVIVAIVMVVYFVMIRRGEVPTWCGIVAIVVAVTLVIVMGYSYMMSSRPTWDSVAQPLALLGAGFAIGTGLFAAIDAKTEEDAELNGKLNVVSTIVNCATTAIYVIVATAATSALVEIPYYFDPNHPTAAVETASAFSPFAGSSMAFTVAALALAIAAVVVALVGRKKKSVVIGVCIAMCVSVSAMALRAMFFATGVSVFMLY